MQTVVVGTVAIAVLTAHLCRSVFHGATRAGRKAFASRAYARQTCTAVVESSCNAAKRRLVTVTGSLPTTTHYRRRLFPSSSSSSSSPRRSERRSSSGITSGGIRSDNEQLDQYVEQLRVEGIECIGPMHPLVILPIESKTSLPYMMTGALLSSPVPSPRFWPNQTQLSSLDSESLIEAEYDEGDGDEVDGLETEGCDVTDHGKSDKDEVDDDKLDESDLIAHTNETNIAISSISSYDESIKVDEKDDMLSGTVRNTSDDEDGEDDDEDEDDEDDEDDDMSSDTLSDTSEDEKINGGPPAYSFASPLPQPVFEELDKIHRRRIKSIS